MGLDLKPLVVREKTKLESFASKVIAIDAYNAIYQFLAIIRGPDGSHLSDSSGRVTSHLSGLLYRNINFLSLGIKPVYVFDGKPPSLKSAEIEKRRQTKIDDTIKYEKSIYEVNLEDDCLSCGEQLGVHTTREIVQCALNELRGETPKG